MTRRSLKPKLSYIDDHDLARDLRTRTFVITAWIPFKRGKVTRWSRVKMASRPFPWVETTRG